MQITNVKKKNWLLIPISFFIVASLLLAGCWWSGEETHTIKLVDTSYETQWLSNAMHKIIIEEGYGYPVEALTVSVPVGQVSLS